MIYDVIVKSTSGAIIFQSANASLDGILTTREALIKRFAWENEWRDDYADLLTVTAVDPEANICIELRDLQVSFA